MKREEPSNPRDKVRSRAAQDPFFLGYTLGRFAAERGLADVELAEYLGCPVERLPRLMACRSPDPSTQRFGADVGDIAEFTSCVEDRLLAVLRESSVLNVLRALPDATVGAPERARLLAARQRGEKPPTEGDREHDDDRLRGT